MTSIRLLGPNDDCLSSPLLLLFLSLSPVILLLLEVVVPLFTR